MTITRKWSDSYKQVIPRGKDETEEIQDLAEYLRSYDDKERD